MSNIREEQTTGYGHGGSDNHPITKVYDGDRYLGALRNDGYRKFDGDFVNDWSAFAGGAAVPMPAGVTDRETAKRVLIDYCRRASNAWMLAGSKNH